MRLHPLQRLDAEEAQAGLHDGGGPGAEHETAGLHGGVVDEHAVGGVEGAVGGGEFVQVGAEVVRTQFLEGLVQRGSEGQQFAGEGDLGRGLRIRGALLALADGEAGLAEDGADTDDGVEEVG